MNSTKIAMLQLMPGNTASAKSTATPAADPENTDSFCRRSAGSRLSERIAGRDTGRKNR
ncbi:MAG: hypothetical protein MR291_03335 [Oscillospiraceae bacterium]|nr:hypothetical protein [Oscillospiraceae bacterium]